MAKTYAKIDSNTYAVTETETTTVHISRSALEEKRRQYQHEIDKIDADLKELDKIK